MILPLFRFIRVVDAISKSPSYCKCSIYVQGWGNVPWVRTVILQSSGDQSCVDIHKAYTLATNKATVLLGNVCLSTNNDGTNFVLFGEQNREYCTGAATPIMELSF